MDDENDYLIPRELDAPALFFIWEWDSALLVIVVLVLSGVMNMYIPGAIAAYVISRGYSYLKEEGGRGLILKLLFWYTPSNLWLTTVGSSHVREYIG